MSERGDFYSVLGVSPDADAKTIRAAYRKQARLNHPDHGGDAEAFHRVQQAWETLGNEQSRASYDSRRHGGGQGAGGSSQSAERASDDDAGSGVYSPTSFTASTRGPASRTASSSGARRDSPRRADLTPVYEPALSSPEPLSLALTSQKVHGGFGRPGILGGGGAVRRGAQLAALLEKHVLSVVPTARLFNAVRTGPASSGFKARLGGSGAGRVPHVLLTGRTMVLVSAVEIPGETVSWDGRDLRARGRRITVPSLVAEARQLRTTLQEALRAGVGTSPALRIEQQTILLSPQGDLFTPVVQTVAGASTTGAPLAAGRAFGHLANVLLSDPEPALVDRHLMAALRAQLSSPEEDL
ncbi:J domain-containing protein [Nesterenkonia flava]|uniref:DnaJ domain-containing protein n=1 Tax=Nesterenkonia flava TaxID=469799 RepID=A0ABU1FWF5_9MICC|nr:DnaJ domain-containing protein [Nesterenkonia flava]MDR5712473.1 DnaJ domain-containing protein [Nesterenkonia flava]